MKNLGILHRILKSNRLLVRKRGSIYVPLYSTLVFEAIRSIYNVLFHICNYEMVELQIFLALLSYQLDPLSVRKPVCTLISFGGLSQSR